ncbi:single-pass membrane and coiled-coil domain-containing protein 1 [Phaenicophaeus curvirostris]|uniref:single-pass membrane and coiled-coil domain-containing protein 1 n=1 Tax=Phaenicophaeus curvirostris TaxID=33595 RepID=UPI0037F0DBD3
MAKSSISLHSLNETLNRVEAQLQSVASRFVALDSSLRKLAWKFELQSQALEEEKSQEGLWPGLPVERPRVKASKDSSGGRWPSRTAQETQDPRRPPPEISGHAQKGGGIQK